MVSNVAVAELGARHRTSWVGDCIMRIRKTGQGGLDQTDIFDSESGLTGAFTQPLPMPVELAWNGTGTGVVATAATGNQDIDGLLYTQHWGTLNVSFGFPASASQYGAYPTGETSTFQPVNAQNDRVHERAVGIRPVADDVRHCGDSVDVWRPVQFRTYL